MNYKQISRYELMEKEELINEIINLRQQRIESSLLNTNLPNILIENIPVFMFVLQENDLIYVNSAVESLLGYSKNELLSMGIEKIIYPGFKNIIGSGFLEQQKDANSDYHDQLKLIRKDGQEIWVDVFFNVADFEGKEIIVASAYDITEYKQVIEKLELRETQFYDILENMPELVERESPNYKVIYANKAFKRFHGISNEEIIGTNSLFLIYEEDRPKVLDVIKMFSPQNPVVNLDTNMG